VITKQPASTGRRDRQPQQRGVGLSDLGCGPQAENLTTPADPADPFEYNGKRVLPFVTSNFRSGCAVRVFHDLPRGWKRGEAVVRVRLLKDGRAIATLRARRGGAGCFRRHLDAVEADGQARGYEVRATVTQGNSSTEGHSSTPRPLVCQQIVLNAVTALSGVADKKWR